MARASYGFSAPLYSSLCRLTQFPVTLTSSRTANLRNTRDVSTSDFSTNLQPSLEVIGGAVDSFLPAFNTLNLPYAPYPVVGWNKHLETIFAAFYRSFPDVRFRRQCFRTRDDGTVSLDWIAGDDRSLPSDSPVLILLPGLTGGSEDTYVRHMLLRARSKGWRGVVFNSRGCGESPVTTAQFYSASFLGDITEVVEYVGNRYPKANIYATGWSLGANILVRYVGQEFHPCPLSGAISLCNPFNLVTADEDFRKGFNIVYDKALANSLCKIFKRHALLFEDIGGDFNIPLAANAKSVREFDEGLTRVSFGFESVDDYYSKSCSSDSIRNVSIPLLCIQVQRKGDTEICPRSVVSAQRRCYDLSPRRKGAISCLDFLLAAQRRQGLLSRYSSLVQRRRLCGKKTPKSPTVLGSSNSSNPSSLIFLAENDPIAPSRGIPREDIKKNPNCMLIVTPKGGHLGWVAGCEAPFGAPWTDPVVMDYLEYLEQSRSSTTAPSTKLQDSKSIGNTHDLHHVEV